MDRDTKLIAEAYEKGKLLPDDVEFLELVKAEKLTNLMEIKALCDNYSQYIIFSSENFTIFDIRRIT